MQPRARVHTYTDGRVGHKDKVGEAAHYRKFGWSLRAKGPNFICHYGDFGEGNRGTFGKVWG